MREVLLVGAGPMGEAYFRVLQALHVPAIIVCRTSETALQFQSKTGELPFSGGIESWLETNQDNIPDKAIVATPVEALTQNAISLIKAGVKKILLEKPGGLNIQKLKELLFAAKNHSADVFIAYNRRFYTSVIEAENIIKNDDGLRSLFFEFTEWAHIIEPLKKGPGVKERWFLANSTHVVDLSFFISGYPEHLNILTNGRLDWHPSAAQFSGSGMTDKGVVFSYISDWEAPGRWAIELMTNNHRLYLKPLEKLQIQKKGSVQLETVNLKDELDTLYKPGLYRMTEAFLKGETDRLCTLEYHTKMMVIYCKMANYSDE
jgi:predicted dehydrogenase